MSVGELACLFYRIYIKYRGVRVLIVVIVFRVFVRN